MDVDFDAGEVPAETLGDRLWRALKNVGMGKGEMARYLKVDGNTVSRYINDKVVPNSQTLRLWALRCGVPYAWLRHALGPVLALATGAGTGATRYYGWSARQNLAGLPAQRVPGTTWAHSSPRRVA